jgi:hypothetical protein
MACETMTAVISKHQKRGPDGNFTETSTQCLRRLADDKETITHEARDLIIDANKNKTCGELLGGGIGHDGGGIAPPTGGGIIPPVHHDNPMAKPPASDTDTSADIAGIAPTGTFVDFVVTQGNNTHVTERGYKDPTTGASTGPFGSIDKTVIEAGVEIFGVFARIFPPGGSEPKHHLTLEVVLKKADATIKSILVKVGGKVYDLPNFNGSTTYTVNTTEGFDAFNNAHPTVNVGLQLKR